MRRTPRPNMSVLEVPKGETWAGIIDAPKRYIAIAARLDDGERVIVTRLSPTDAFEMAVELMRLSNVLVAENN